MICTGSTTNGGIKNIQLIDKAALQKAVDEERYEDAALIRDGFRMVDAYHKAEREKYEKELDQIKRFKMWKGMISIVFDYPIEAVDDLEFNAFKMLVGECEDYLRNLKFVDLLNNEKLFVFMKENNLI
jgi:hypothetical protein